MTNMNLFHVLTVNPAPFSDRAKEAGLVTLMGMVAIFTVLALLWLIIEILHRVLSGEPKTVKEKAPEPVKRSEPEAPVSAPVENVSVATEDDGALIAVITAAVSAAMAEDGYNGGFRVVSFKRAATNRRRA